jgi:putative heme-binding domain-containing protein
MEEVTRVESILLQPALDRLQVFTLIQALGEGLHRTRSSLALVDQQSRFGPYYAQALNVAIDVASPEPARVSAVRLLAVSPYKFSDLGDWMLLLCAPPPSPVLQSAAIDALGRFDEPGVVQNMFACWPNLGPSLRQQAVATLLGRTSHVGAVLDAIETRRIPGAALYSTQANFLRYYGDPAISQRALRLLGPTRRQRPEVVAAFKPALRLPGRAIQGRQIFLNQCAGCHSFNGQGRALGPDLAAARIAGNEKLLSAILEPNASVPADYATCVIITKEGENHVGIKTDENLDAVTLSQPGGVHLVWPRLNIQSLQTQPWSLMPEGLEQSLSIQDAADLLDYLMTAPR